MPQARNPLTLYANPARFRKLAAGLRPLCGGLGLAALLWGLWLALVRMPADFQQGEAVRIMAIHVPAATLSMAVYASMAVAAFIGYVWRHPLADLYIRAVAAPGAVFTLICLLTGSFWGRPSWGAWWAWDARLVAELVLFFLYIGHMALLSAFDDPERGDAAGRILILVGAVDLPVIKFSVDWWNSLHQGSSFGMGGARMPPEMLMPVLAMSAAFSLLLGWFALYRLETEMLKRKLAVQAAAE